MLVAFVDHNISANKFRTTLFGSQYGYHLFHPTFDTQWWIEALRKAIPQEESEHGKAEIMTLLIML